MNKKFKVNFILAIIVIIIIIIVIFAFRKMSGVTVYDEDYIENIRILNDTIKQLNEDIVRYRIKIEQIDLERDAIREQLKRIIDDNKKIDSELSTGDWDINLNFLTDFLSKKDSLGK